MGIVGWGCCGLVWLGGKLFWQEWRAQSVAGRRCIVRAADGVGGADIALQLALAGADSVFAFGGGHGTGVGVRERR